MLKRRSRSLRRASPQTGFSLLEAIIVVAIILVLAGLTGKGMFSAIYAYRVSSSARQVSAAAQLARVKAMSRNGRYRLYANAATNRYRIERCTQPTGCDLPSATWNADQGSDWVPLPAGVSFTKDTPVSLTTAPPGMGSTPAQATDMTFNTRGLLMNGANPLDYACFYVQGQANPPYAVCSTLPGSTIVFRFRGSNWEKM